MTQLTLSLPSSRRVPDIRTPSPSSPGSETSRKAAERMTVEKRRPQWMTILQALSGCRYAISREELSRLTGLRESSLCARLAELRPIWVEASPGSCVSSAGVHVDGYRLTDAGRKRALDRQVDGPGSSMLSNAS